MLGRFAKYINRKEREFHDSFDHDISSAEGRRRSEWHFNWLDHAVLRKRWHNFDEIAPGVYRSNHPNHDRFTAYAEMGIKTILNLRGPDKHAHYLFEVESCAKLGLQLVDCKMSARRPPTVDELTALMTAFETIDRPFLMHCKSGADRTGLASALYVMLYQGASLAEARKQLSFRYVHIKRSKTGVLDHFFDLYEARTRQSDIPIAQWINDEYDPAALRASFAARQASLKPWQGWR